MRTEGAQMFEHLNKIEFNHINIFLFEIFKIAILKHSNDSSKYFPYFLEELLLKIILLVIIIF